MARILNAVPNGIPGRPEITAHMTPHAEPNVILCGPRVMLRGSHGRAIQNSWPFRVEPEVMQRDPGVVLHRFHYLPESNAG